MKSIFNGYLGWLDGNVSNLDPLPSEDYAKTAALSGGEKETFEALEKAILDEDMQWGCS